VLNEHGLVSVQRVANANAYSLSGYEALGWAKIPRRYLLEGGSFRNLEIRGRIHLEALKIYLSLLTFRQNAFPHVSLTYDKIGEYTGIPRARIRRSLDVLFSHAWISLTTYTDDVGGTKIPNTYFLRGDFWGSKKQTYAPAGLPSLPAFAATSTAATASDFSSLDLD
jgi:hypothetical protein